ncbi:MAG: nuclear transport factor 2 family protein, partial [Ferruginibacter sp.]
CDTVTMASCFSEDIEFYHDQGGLMTNKDSLMLATKNNICGKVTRVLVSGSIEVYPIANYGAIEMGQHYFINNREPKPKYPSIGKFVHTWKKETAGWKLTRVISLH